MTRPVPPAPGDADPAAALADEIERIAQWLHDEVEWPEYPYPNASWPEHPGDTGQRNGGWLHIVPSDVQEEFRNIARRLTALRQNPAAGARGWPSREDVARANAAGDSFGTLEWAFELGTDWQSGLVGQTLEDSRSVGRTLLSPIFDGLLLDLDGYNSFEAADLGIVDSKRRIKRALALLPAPSPRAELSGAADRLVERLRDRARYQQEGWLASANRGAEAADALEAKTANESALAARAEELERERDEADGEFAKAAVRVMQAYPGFVARDWSDGVAADDFETFLREDMDEAWDQAERWKARAKAAQRRVAELEAENGRLREGLRPFVAAIKTSSSLASFVDLPDTFPVEFADCEGGGEHCLTYGDLRRIASLLAEPPKAETGQEAVPLYLGKFSRGDRVHKIKGSSWQGRVCGHYSTDLTPFGVCIESERETGSVQIYPETAVEAVEEGGRDA